MARRKQLLTPAEIARIQTMSGLGLNTKQIAAIMGLSERTFFRRIKDTPDASGSIEKGRAIAASHVTKTAYELASSGKCPAMTMFWLKCRERWKEISVQEHTGKDGEPISFVQLVEKYSQPEKVDGPGEECAPAGDNEGEDPAA